MSEVAAERAAHEKLVPLACGGCGAALVLEDRDAIACPYCHATVPVPARHREALRAEREDAKTRDEARRLYDRLSRPTGKPLAAVGFVFGGLVERALHSWKGSLRLVIALWVLILNFFVVAGAVLIAEFALLAAGGHLLHRNLNETLTNAELDERDAVLLGVWVALILLGAAVGVYARRSEVAVGSLQAALSARAPLHAGGPATCRGCGAPLDVQPDDVGVRCLYCGADNLVRIAAPVLARFERVVAEAARRVEEAHAKLEAEERARRRTLVLRVLVLGLVFTVWIGGAALDVRARRAATPILARFPPEWAAYATDPRPVLRRPMDPRRHVWEKRTEVVPMPAHCRGAAPAYAPDACSGAGCETALYVPLRRDERVRLVNLGARAANATLSWHLIAGFPASIDEPFGDAAGAAALAPGQTGELRATWTAWHEIRVTVAGAKPGDPAGVCVEVAH